MWSHPTWCLVVALSVLVSGSKVPRQIVYQIRPAPVSSLHSPDGRYLFDDGVTDFQFPSFGLKTQEGKALRSNGAVGFGLSGYNDSVDVESSSSSSSSASSSRSEEGSSAATKEEITEVPKFGISSNSGQTRKQVNHQILQLQPEQIQQIFNSYNPQTTQIVQIQQQQQQEQQQDNIDVGPRYEYKSLEENANTSADDIKTAQTEAITEEKLQSAYSERREKRRRKQQQQEPPGDASYAFGYETDEASRHEVADPDGTVKGWYTYVDDEGTLRKIIYTAGAGKGFVVLGKEKIKGPGTASPAQQQPRRKQHRPQNNRVNTEYGYAADSSTISSLKHQKPPSTPSSFTNYYNNWDLAKAGTSNPPGPTSVSATQETPSRTKKPVFIVKIRRPVHKDQWRKKNKLYNLEMAGDSSSSLLLIPPPSQFLANSKHKLLSNPEPLAFPATSLKSATRTRRRPTMTLSDVVPSLRKSRIKKYPTPPIYYADDDDESGYDDGSSSQGSSASSSGEYDNSQHDSEEHSGGGGNYGNYGNSGGNGGGRGGGGLPVKSDPDSSYVFGYETDSANRLEKADPYGNVRGSYSYIGSSINQLLSRHHSRQKHVPKYKRSPRKSKKSLKSILDPDGTKRTVHYIAGGKTGFQVIHASPSISRGVRLEAPPGYVVKRVPSLRTSESRYPIPITVPQPSAIVYHIHPDSGWKPWEPTIRKKKVKIHRKKIPKEYFTNARNGIVLLQTHPDPQVNNFPGPVTNFNTNAGTTSSGSGSMNAGSTNTYFKEKITAAGTGTVTARETQIPYMPMSPPIARRRHAPQRGFTAEHHIVEIDDDGSSQENTAATMYQYQQKSKSSSSQSSPSSSAPSSSGSSTTSQSQPQPPPEQVRGQYTPAPFESMKEPSGVNRMQPPSPVQLQPTQVAIKSRGAPTQTGAGLDTSSSNHHPVAFTSDGKLQVDVPTVIIEAIEAKSSSSLAPKKDDNTIKNATPVSHHHHNRPSTAALTQQSSSSDLSTSSTSNLIKGSTPTSSPGPYELVSASSALSYQSTSVSAPTPPAASASPYLNSQKTYNPSYTTNHNSITHSLSSLSSSSSSSVASTAPPKSRRRHHRSKTASNTTPTSPSSVSSASSSSSNTIKAVAGGNMETTTTMSSSKRLINRLAATDHDATVAAQQ